MPGLTDLDLDAIFTYHPPTRVQADLYVQIREKAREFAGLLLETVPQSAEQTLAIRKVQEAVMLANAGIAIHTG